jgi:superfamily I DNA and/or RNA helicase
MNNISKKTKIDFQRQQSLLQMEFEYEKGEFIQKSEKTDTARKVKRGLCWYPVTPARNYYNSLNQLVIEIKRNSEDEEAEHLFEHNRTVCFFHQSSTGKITYLDFTATVNYVLEDMMLVELPNTDAILKLRSKSTLGVQLYFNETTFRIMYEALSEVMHAEDNRLAELRDTLSGPLTPGFRQLLPVKLPWLNSAQDNALNKVLGARDVAIIHGPPGTGKTTTLVEIIYETLHRETQILVCAQSNAAVDCISEKLVDRGIPTLRIGNPTRVNDKMLSFTYEQRFENHPDYHELWNIRNTIREKRSIRFTSKSERNKVNKEIKQLRKRAIDLENQINKYLFDNTRVIASTLVGSNNWVLNGRRFSTLFIDEAAQALEAACWIAIRKADRVVFAGDHCQLPPTIKCIEAAREGLNKTLMEKMINRHPAIVTILKIQYRMNEAIMRFSSEWFYNGKLEAAPEVRHRQLLKFDAPISWIDTSEMEFHEEIAGDFGRINKQEAKLLMEQLESYIRKLGKDRILDEQINFGLISPYKAQVQYIRSLIKNNEILKPLQSLISVNTVDGFQGLERDVIFISLVRANENGDIGFLIDLRRMNVAITRARMKLVILGDVATLTKHVFYKKLVEAIEYCYMQIKH